MSSKKAHLFAEKDDHFEKWARISAPALNTFGPAAKKKEVYQVVPFFACIYFELLSFI